MQSATGVKIAVSEERRCFYTTGDLIRGHVSLGFGEDEIVDDLTITLEGKASIRVEKHFSISTQAGCLYVDHTFLRMSCPIQSEGLSEGRLARHQRSYNIPFNFTVPDGLLPYACKHAISDDREVNRAHLLLPPSLGTFGTNSILFDNLDPRRAKVTYTINVRYKKHFADGSFKSRQESKQVYLIPDRGEEPPLWIEQNDPYYMFSDQRIVFQGLPNVSKAVGCLVAYAAQPTSVILTHPCETTEHSSTSAVSVKLRFQSLNQENSPPQLDLITIKLCSFTFSGVLPPDITPGQSGSCDATKDYSQYTDTTRLKHCIPGKINWTKQEPTAGVTETDSRQCQLKSKATGITASSSPISAVDYQYCCYTSSLQIPIQLPRQTFKHSKQRLLTPSFKSCIVSRMYSLEFKLSYKAVSATFDESANRMSASSPITRYLIPRSHLILKLPLQIRVGHVSVPRTSAFMSHSNCSCFQKGHQLDERGGDLAAERLPKYTAISRSK